MRQIYLDHVSAMPIDPRVLEFAKRYVTNDFGTLTSNGWGIAYCEKQKFEVNSTFKAVTAAFYGTNIFPILGNIKYEGICPI